MTTPIRIGVIGTGIGATHIKVFHHLDGVEVVAVASADRQRAVNAAAQYGIRLATDDYRALIASDVDAVVISTPPALHREMVVAAATAGKHVFCEKPLSLTFSDAVAMIDAVSQAGIVDLINFHLRFAPGFSTAHRLLEAGKIGQITNIDASVTVNPIDYVNASWGSDSKLGWFTDPAHGGGLLRSSAGPHLVDLILWLGGSIETLVATTMTSRPRVPLAAEGREIEVRVDDAFAMIGRLSNGALATMRGLAVAEHETEFEVTIHGTEGSLYISPSSLRGMLQGDDQVHEISIDHQDPRRAIAGTFIDAIRGNGGRPRPDFTDGARAQAVLEACTQSAAADCWVEVQQTPNTHSDESRT